MADPLARVSETQERFHVVPTAESHFSWMRTRLSVERTMMSWIRTSVALIGFGFTIVQFFERFSAFEGVGPAQRPWAPRYVGLSLIATGVLVLLISGWQYRSVLHYLKTGDFASIAGVTVQPRQSPMLAVTLTIIFVGLFTLTVVLTRAF